MASRGTSFPQLSQKKCGFFSFLEDLNIIMLLSSSAQVAVLGQLSFLAQPGHEASDFAGTESAVLDFTLETEADLLPLLPLSVT